MSKSKKLPDVWVSPSDEGKVKAWESRPDPKLFITIRYTPAKKPPKVKKCKCPGRCATGAWKFCPYCRGVLEVTR